MSEHEDFEMIDGQYDNLMQESFLNKQVRDGLINPKHHNSIKLTRKESELAKKEKKDEKEEQSSDDDFEILENLPQL